MMDFDWQQVEQYAFDYIIDCVEQIHQQHPDEKIYGAMFHCFYGDGKYIYFPPISVGTEELLQRVVASYQLDNDNQIKELSNKLRWSGADLADYMFDEGAMFDKCSELAKQVTEYAKEASGYDFDDESTEENFDK